MISIVAMLNKHQRGEVIFGVRNDGAVVGQQVSDKTIRDVSKAIADHIEPKVYHVIELVSIEAKQCIKVRVEGSEHPYYAYGRAYIRVGDDTRLAWMGLRKRLVLGIYYFHPKPALEWSGCI